MPRWTTHSEGGGWLGGGTQVPDCSPEQQTAITDAFNAFIDKACLDCFPGLRNCLRRKWDEVEIDCTDPDCSELDGRSSGNTILMCNTSADRVVRCCCTSSHTHAAEPNSTRKRSSMPASAEPVRRCLSETTGTSFDPRRASSTITRSNELASTPSGTRTPERCGAR
jgi:hypothetical protein